MVILCFEFYNLSRMRLDISPNPKKKLRATFNDGTHTDFGARGYKDYIQYSETEPEIAEERKRLYHIRHRKDLNGEPQSPGVLSAYLLWNKNTLIKSYKDYVKVFGNL